MWQSEHIDLNGLMYAQKNIKSQMQIYILKTIGCQKHSTIVLNYQLTLPWQTKIQSDTHLTFHECFYELEP